MCTGCNKFCVFTHCVYRECAELIEARPASLHASYCVWYCVSLKGDTVPLVSTRGQNVSCGSARAHQVSFSKPWSVSWPSHSKNIYKIPKEWLFWKFTLGSTTNPYKPRMVWKKKSLIAAMVFYKCRDCLCLALNPDETKTLVLPLFLYLWFSCSCLALQ